MISAASPARRTSRRSVCMFTRATSWKYGIAIVPPSMTTLRPPTPVRTRLVSRVARS